MTKMFVIFDNTHNEILEGYTSRAQAIVRLIELCEGLETFDSPADYQRAVRLGYFDDIYSIEEVEIKG